LDRNQRGGADHAQVIGARHAVFDRNPAGNTVKGKPFCKNIAEIECQPTR
jgi:hypothetical protein